jgi:hypothetical protein
MDGVQRLRGDKRMISGHRSGSNPGPAARLLGFRRNVWFSDGSRGGCGPPKDEEGRGGTRRREVPRVILAAESADGSWDRAAGGPGRWFQCAPEMIRRTACPSVKKDWVLDGFSIDWIAAKHADQRIRRPSPICNLSGDGDFLGQAPHRHFEGAPHSTFPREEPGARPRNLLSVSSWSAASPEPAPSSGCATERPVRAAAAILTRADSRFLGPATS